MKAAGLSSEFSTLETYGINSLPQDILTNIQGYAGLNLYLNGLQKYARKDLLFDSSELVSSKDLIGVPTWVDAGLDGNPYYIEVITRKPQTGELGDEVAFHLVHKSKRKDALDMPSSARQQGRKLLLDTIIGPREKAVGIPSGMSYYQKAFGDIFPKTAIEFENLSSESKNKIVSQFLTIAKELAIGKISEGSNKIFDTEFHDLAENAIIDCTESTDMSRAIESLLLASYHPETLNMEDVIKEIRRLGKE